ncbi:MAG: oligoendopeptidase F [Clostridiales bacterium]|nr:oligoendopeptidase F [Clostridiales bacterium]
MSNLKKALPTRAESDPTHQWRTADIYPSDQAFLAAVEQLRAAGAELAAYRGTLAQPGRLLAFLQRADQLGLLMGDAGSYAGLRADEDTANATYQRYEGMMSSLSVELSASLAFFTPEVLAMADRIPELLAQDGALEVYRKHLEDILRQKDHILPEREEYLLSLAGEIAGAPEEVFSMLNNADMRFGSIQDEDGDEVELTHGRYLHFLESADRRVRREAFETLYAVYLGHRNTLAALLNAHVSKNKFHKIARRYGSTLEMCLDGNRIPPAVYHSLIGAVRDGHPAFYRYMDLRRRALGLDALHMYDLYVSIVKNPFKQLTYSQAQALVLEAVRPLGEDYCRRIERAYREGWIDVYENRGKRSGAYSNGNPTCHPFVLLNHQDNLESAMTLAHELGHALHSDYSNEAQPPVYRNYSIFVAEVASTVNEALLLEHLMATSEGEALAYLHNHYLEQFRATLFRQTMFAEFELAVHAEVEGGGTLTPDLLDELYGGLCAAYFGEGVTLDPQIRAEWSRIPHFYYDFYVYQYATGFAAAQAIADRILHHGGAEDYLAFLKLGDALPPLEALKVAGVDLTTPAPVTAALRRFEASVEQLEKWI